jgi:hypothetical protein
MSKEEIKEDIINDINRLLSKDTGDLEKVNEMFNNMPDAKNKQQLPQQQAQSMPPQMQQMPMQGKQMPSQMPMPSQMQQMPSQMQMPPQMQGQQMQQMLMQGQPMPPQMQGQPRSQMPQIPLTQQQVQQLNSLPPQQQQQYYQQLVQQFMAMNNPMNNQMNNQKEQFIGTIDYNALIYGNRDTLVLILLYVFLLTPQINNLMVKIPYTSDNGYYPNYLGILLRGLIFVGMYIGMKKFNLI